MSSLRQWVVDFVTGDFHAGFATTTFVIYLLLTSHTVTVVTLFRALMFATWKETFTKRITGGYWLCTILSLPSNQFFNRIMPARTIKDP